MAALHVTCWDTFCVTNLTQQRVTLRPLAAGTGTLAALSCSSGQTQSLSFLWRAAYSAPAAAAREAAAAAESASSGGKAAQQSRATAPQQQPQPGALTWPCAVDIMWQGSDSDAASPPVSEQVSLAQPCCRRWLSGASAGGSPRQVAYQLRRIRGRHHLVLFKDQQPPLRLCSTLTTAVDVGLSAPQHEGHGSFTYGETVGQVR